MKRSDFLKKTTLAGLSMGLLSKLAAQEKHEPTPEETEGPFPTHKPGKLVTKNITAGKKGIPLLIQIAVHDVSDECKPLQHAIVDIWHCDSKGEYSEYGGKDEHGMMGHPPMDGDSMHMPPPPPHHDGDTTKKGFMPPPPFGGSMQATDYTNQHFLRGRQVADVHGGVAFHSIYPGWYVSRAPHIHVHVYDAKGRSLLITQIALPEAISKVVYTKTVYAAHGQAETSNSDDMVFSDSIAEEMATVTGNAKDGYKLMHSIYVNG